VKVTGRCARRARTQSDPRGAHHRSDPPYRREAVAGGPRSPVVSMGSRASRRESGSAGAGRRYRSPVSTAASFDDEVAAALAAPVAGWCFDWLTGRAVGAEPSWSYRELAAPLVAQARALVDVDTGGGELLASLGAEVGLPVTTFATEGWGPNLSPARVALELLGVRVLPAPADDVLPVPGAAVDLVLDRHGRLPAVEIARVLRAGGVLLTQQVTGVGVDTGRLSRDDGVNRSRTGEPMHATQVTANLRVPDLETAKTFYRDYLGLSVEEFNLGWVARYTRRDNGAHVQLVTGDATAAEDSAVSVHTDDVDGAYEEARRLNYEIVHPLTTEPWGVRRFFVRAPDGNVINIVGHPA